jgi:hypothetical protein
MELKSIGDFSKESKILLLSELGYDSDGMFVLDSSGRKVLDRYIEKPIKIDNMVIFPGSTIILDDNPLSIISYIEEFGDVF